MKLRTLSMMMALSLVATSVYAINLPTAGNQVSIGFTGFTGAGFAPSPAAGQLDSDDWRAFSDTASNQGVVDFGGVMGGPGVADLSRGSAAAPVTTGGIYAFTDVPGNPALGWQPSATAFTPGAVELKLTNNTGATINTLNLSFDYLFRNDQGRSNSLVVSYIKSATDPTFATSASSAVPLGWTAILNAASPEVAGSTAWLSNGFATQLAGLSIAPSESIYLRFYSDDVSGSGSRDEFAIDNITVTQVVPEPISLAAWLVLGMLGIIVSGRSRRLRSMLPRP